MKLRGLILTGLCALACVAADVASAWGQLVQTNDTPQPVIELHDVPLHRAIDTLARQGDINYLFDPALFPRFDANGNEVKERTVNFRMENVSAKEVLMRLLNLYGLVMEETPVSRIAVITRAGSALTKQPPSLQTSTNEEPLIPLIEFGDVPMTTAIENLARQAGINYLIDPTVFPTRDAEGKIAGEPVIDFRSIRISAKDVLNRLLYVHKYVLMEDPASNIAIITHASQNTNQLFAGMTDMAIKYRGVFTNNVFTNEVIPLIQFSDVPITTAIENLARQEGVNYMLAYHLGRKWFGSGPGHTAEPLLNIRLENVTAWNTLNRILNLYNLVLIDNPITHIWNIRDANEQAYHFNASLLGLDPNLPPTNTNGIIAVIEFAQVPLHYALENLIRQSSLPIVLDPQLKDSRTDLSGISLSLRWESLTAKQAIVALCQNYDLNIVKDAATDGLRIEPGPAWK
jgi:hypothetical protein